MKRIIAFLLECRYGVRGGIKPPLGGKCAGILYPVRYQYWKLINRLYNWSGVPAKWWNEVNQ